MVRSTYAKTNKYHGIIQNNKHHCIASMKVDKG